MKAIVEKREEVRNVENGRMVKTMVYFFRVPISYSEKVFDTNNRECAPTDERCFSFTCKCK